LARHAYPDKASRARAQQARWATARGNFDIEQERASKLLSWDMCKSIERP
jgi:hypothetical protein